jgi:hypothetical protein
LGGLSSALFSVLLQSVVSGRIDWTVVAKDGFVGALMGALAGLGYIAAAARCAANYKEMYQPPKLRHTPREMWAAA